MTMSGIGRDGGRAAVMGAFALVIALAVALPAAAGSERPPRPPGPKTATEEEVTAYYESGDYAEDTATVARRARRSLRRQLGGKPSDGHDAIVFDIDDTSLSSYECQKSLGGFGNTELAVCVIASGAQTETLIGRGLPAIRPVLRLFQLAKERGVKIWFITGRPDIARHVSLQNLRARGFQGDYKLITHGNVDFVLGQVNDGSLVPYKSGERAKIEGAGYDILVNIGDQHSDLKGGHANETFKIPNPMYYNG
jgi:putative acid phosphatase of HAD superfamily subfamily IIIB